MDLSTQRSNLQGYAGAAIGRGYDRGEGPETIREKGPHGKLEEAIGYLNGLDGIMDQLQTSLFGPVPATNGPNLKGDPSMASLQSKSSEICERLALLHGFLSTLVNRLP